MSTTMYVNAFLQMEGLGKMEVRFIISTSPLLLLATDMFSVRPPASTYRRGAARGGGERPPAPIRGREHVIQQNEAPGGDDEAEQYDGPCSLLVDIFFTLRASWLPALIAGLLSGLIAAVILLRDNQGKLSSEGPMAHVCQFSHCIKHN